MATRNKKLKDPGNIKENVWRDALRLDDLVAKIDATNAGASVTDLDRPNARSVAGWAKFWKVKQPKASARVRELLSLGHFVKVDVVLTNIAGRQLTVSRFEPKEGIAL